MFYGNAGLPKTSRQQTGIQLAKDAKTKKYWDPKSWRSGGCADAVYQQQLNDELAAVEKDQGQLELDYSPWLRP